MNSKTLIITTALTAAALLGGVGTAIAKPPMNSDVGVMIRDCIDVPNRNVGIGSSGAYVMEVQCLLNWAINPSTFPPIAVDGYFGQMTRDKVIKFQQCANARGAGLVVDGEVGRNTAPHLEWWAGYTSYIC